MDEFIEREVSDLGPGESFGEIALLNDAPRTANIKCKSNVDLAVLSREKYTKILSNIIGLTIS
jgi:cAMP-dependent protein kinase regulator